VNRFKKADFFITFTANPYWEELSAMLQDRTNYLARPDLCARVYQMKFKQFMSEMTDNHRLGKLD
jgi:hypothetical protein